MRRDTKEVCLWWAEFWLAEALAQRDETCAKLDFAQALRWERLAFDGRK